MKEHPYGPGRLRFRSNGTFNDGHLEALQADGSWLRLRGVLKIAELRIGVGELPILKAEFTMVEVDVEVLTENVTFNQLPPERLSDDEEQMLAAYRSHLRDRPLTEEQEAFLKRHKEGLEELDREGSAG